MTDPVRLAEDAASVRRCWPAFSELRPHLDSTEFLARWERQRAEGYTIAYIEQDGEIAAAAGFRVFHTMAWGKILYLDDLVTCASRRGRGLGSTLLAWLKVRAREDRCDALHLDTGYQRHAAHKAYLRAGLHFDCHHLAWSIPR